ncbi:nucleoid-associated protein [Rhodococcus sp. Leaf7]|uniref:YbaB/EbfC family nucleoid-associated protein n=1 Tax=unclassified Rhodococcus (in: high G+C Gram-positive bacteria) TaxID=192944 RepID=UPI0005ABC4CA|nr:MULTISPECIES: YbaB/EbfC family nucleoid-associated protein [unclassified Rhodococcus (in: high G+C Gram-positive bacteria)]KIQ16590.1 nucleoid-associated protein [Rhodococcus sp. MEB064]KQU07572.1 nucleoid-associated protein [Rhodococcus sp. Leaf7]KQU43092.1 nucleoid-associated protein [Rhodococcus sp. Leaf247]
MQPGEQPDMSQLLQQAQQMQQQLMAAQAEIAATEVTGSAGGGLVVATVKGSGEVVGLTIDPKVVDPDDVDTLQDLVIGAIADASRAAAEVASQKLGPLAGLAGGGLPGLPGF